MRTVSNPRSVASISARLFILIAATLSLPSFARAQGLPKLLTGGGDGVIKRWDDKGESVTLGKIGQSILGIEALSGGKSIVAIGSDGELHLWDIATKTSFVEGKAEMSDLTAWAVTRDGRRLVVANREGKLGLWSLPDLKKLSESAGPKESIHALKFSPDGTRLISGGDKVILVWKIVPRNGKDEIEYSASIQAHDNEVTALAFSPANDAFASVSSDKYLKSWLLMGQQLKVRAKAGEVSISAIAYSPDGRTIATGDTDGKIRLFDADKGSLLAFAGSGNRGILALAYSDDGRILVGGDDSGSLRYWTVEGGKELKRQNAAHDRGVRSISIER